MYMKAAALSTVKCKAALSIKKEKKKGKMLKLTKLIWLEHN